MCTDLLIVICHNIIAEPKCDYRWKWVLCVEWTRAVTWADLSPGVTMDFLLITFWQIMDAHIQMCSELSNLSDSKRGFQETLFTFLCQVMWQCFLINAIFDISLYPVLLVFFCVYFYQLSLWFVYLLIKLFFFLNTLNQPSVPKGKCCWRKNSESESLWYVLCVYMSHTNHDFLSDLRWEKPHHWNFCRDIDIICLSYALSSWSCTNFWIFCKNCITVA